MRAAAAVVHARVDGRAVVQEVGEEHLLDQAEAGAAEQSLRGLGSGAGGHVRAAELPGQQQRAVQQARAQTLPVNK